MHCGGGGARVSHAAVQRAIEVGVAGIVAGGVDDADLKAVLGYDLGVVAITGSERIGLTVVITEGFGEIAMSERTFRILQQREGRRARREQRPPDSSRGDAAGNRDSSGSKRHRRRCRQPMGGGQLAIGRPLRVIRDPWFGRIVTVSSCRPSRRSSTRVHEPGFSKWTSGMGKKRSSPGRTWN